MKNYAFISYSHKDVKWAKWLLRKLEYFRLPSEIHNEFSDSRYLRPIFRDRDCLDSGFLGDELSRHLKDSKFLIVICSRHSASSQWVYDEIEAFIRQGKAEFIIPFIIDGDGTDISCIPKPIVEWNNAHPRQCLLGISILDEGTRNRDKALIRVISRMLGIDFDVLWKRHARRKLIALSSIASFATVLAFLSYWLAVPLTVEFNLHRQSTQLPDFESATVCIAGRSYEMSAADSIIRTQPIPGLYKGRTASLIFHADRFYLDDTIQFKFGWNREQAVAYNAVRDESFAFFSGYVYEVDALGKLIPVSGVRASVEGMSAVSDTSGFYQIFIPIESQTECKSILLEKDGYCPIFREDECPGENQYIIKKSFEE